MAVTILEAERIFGGLARWQIRQIHAGNAGYALADIVNGHTLLIGTRLELETLIDAQPSLGVADRQSVFPELDFMAKRPPTKKLRGSFQWGKPLERPKPNRWEPRKGETRVFGLLRSGDGEFGKFYVVRDLESDEEMFLPNHTTLNRLLDAAKLKTGAALQIKCLKKGSPNAGDFYDYEVRISKRNAPF